MEVSMAAKRWTESLERFKFSVDEMYEICRDSGNIKGCKEALLYLGNASHDFEALIGMINVEKQWTEESEGIPQAVAWEVKATAPTPKTAVNAWHVVKGRRRKSCGASSDSSAEDSKEAKKTSVYERLAYNLPRPVRSPSSTELIDPGGLQVSNNSNFMCPRSAMDLPQTKASMAKMAYSRERLWKGQIKPLLEEKLQRRQSARLTYSQVAKRPANLANKTKSTPEASRGSREPSMASISETNEENDDNLSTCTMADMVVVSKIGGAQATTLETETEALLDELSGDDEWRAMTAEEESLAQEEESLQKEILEEERSSIDDEFEREANRRFGQKKSWKAVVDQWKDRNAKIQSPTDIVYRKPGEFAAVHEKLLSPSRKRADSPKRLAERQQKAFELRQKLLDDKAVRLRALHQKVEEVKRQKTAVEEKKRVLLSTKMSTAVTNRERNIAEVVKKAREDDYKIQEIQMIKLLEGMSRKMELNARTKEREAKLAELAEQQAKKAEAKAAKHAQVVENRAAAAASKVEQIEKKEARFALVTAARNEKLEETRQKQRIVAQRIDKVREKENQSTLELLEKVSTKMERAEKNHEEAIESVKQRAADMSTPKPTAQFVVDSLLGNASTEHKYPKKCNACDVIIPSSITATAHIVSTTHVAGRQLEKKPYIQQEFLREFDTFTDINANDSALPIHASSDPTASLRKKKSKIRQKLLKTSIVVSIFSDSIEKSLFKYLKELESSVTSCLKAEDVTEANRSSIERCLTEISNYLANSPAKDKLRVRLFHSPYPLLLSQLLCLKVFSTAGHVPAIRRLFMKTCAFVGPLLGIESLKHDGLFSPMLINFMEAVTNQIAICANDQIIAVLMILVESMPSGNFTKADKDRLGAIGAFLMSHNLIDCLKQYLQIVENTGLELSPRVVTSPIAVITSVVVGLLSGALETPGKCEPAAALLEATIVTVLNRIYNSLTKASPLQPHLIGHFFSCFGTLVIHLAPTKPAFLKSILFASEAETAFKGVVAANAVLSRRIQGLESNNFRLLAIRVVAYLAKLDEQISYFCQIGWQHSVLDGLCQQTFDLQCPPPTKHAVLQAIIVIVQDKPSVVEAMIATEYTVNWLVLFLQIWGKLQKVRKALQKSLPKSTDDDVSNVHDSDRTTESTVTTVKSKKPRSFKTSAFNFATFRRRFNRLEIPASGSQTGALPLAISTNTGMDESLERDVGLDSSTSNSVDSMAVADNNEREPNRRVPDSAIPNRQRAALGCIRQNEGYRFSISSDAMDDDLDDLEEDDDVMEEFEIDSRVLSKLSSQPNLFPQLPPPKLPSVISFDTEPYIPEQNLMPKLIHIYEKFADVFAVDDVVNIPLLRLMELRKYLTTLPYIEQFFEAIPIGNLIHFSTNIVETILHLIDDLDDVNDTVVRHVRFYTRFLCTCGLQSQKFRSTFERHSALHWFAMLRFEPIRYDIINSFCHFTPELLSLYTDDTFFVFLTETVANYQYLPDYDQQRRYIIHYVARLAQTYPMLLYRAYQEFNRSVFNEFLLIMERVVRFDHLHIDTKREPPLLPTAVQFIVKFFDMAIDDFKDERSDYHMLVTRLCRLMDIMTNVIKNLPSFRHIFETPALMHNVCALQNLLVKGDEIINDLPTSHRQPFIVRARPTVSRDFDDAALSNSAGSSSVDGDISPPERKYPRLSISNDGTNVYERPGTSMRLFPLPSPEIVSVDATTSFRSRNAFLSLFEQRKISRFYIVNLKRSTMGLVGALCCASAEHRNIAAEYKIIEAIFKTARISELMKHDYGPVIKRTLIEICTKHVKNTEALSKIEHLPSHLVTKDDILPLLTSANETH